MRPSLLPNLIAAAGRNMARGFADLALFEVGQVYGGDRPEDERMHASGRPPRHERPAPLGEARRAGRCLRRQGRCARRARRGRARRSTGCRPSPRARPGIHPGRVGSLMLGPKNRLAVFGEMHPRVLAAMDVAGPLVAFEIDLDAIPLPKSAAAPRARRSTPPTCRRSTRDFAFVVGARRRRPTASCGRRTAPTRR